MTPSPPPLGISTSAVIDWERFFTLMKAFSMMPVIPFGLTADVGGSFPSRTSGSFW